MQPTLAPAPAPAHQLTGPQASDSFRDQQEWDDQAATTEAEQALRAHLLQNIQQDAVKAAGGPSEVNGHEGEAMMLQSHSPLESGMSQQHSPSPQQQSTPSVHMSGTTPEHGSQGSPEGDSQDTPKRGGKRELSTSKRAAQNRAAQRAFRQRKEGYIKKLEEQVRDLNALQESYKAIQNENYQLRDYIIVLQSRLIESQGEEAVPPAPILLAHQHQAAPHAIPTHLVPVPTSAAPAAGQAIAPPLPVPIPNQQILHPSSAPTVAPQPPSVPVSAPPRGPVQPQSTTPNTATTLPHAQHPTPAATPTTASTLDSLSSSSSIPVTISSATPSPVGFKRTVEEEDAAFNGYVAKKLRGELGDPSSAAQPLEPLSLSDAAQAGAVDANASASSGGPSVTDPSSAA